jgi:hypothetical protein
MMHFTHDYEQGIADERERIIKLLGEIAIDQYQRLDSGRTDSKTMEIITATCYSLQSLIKTGEGFVQ